MDTLVLRVTPSLLEEERTSFSGRTMSISHAAVWMSYAAAQPGRPDHARHTSSTRMLNPRFVALNGAVGPGGRREEHIINTHFDLVLLR